MIDNTTLEFITLLLILGGIALIIVLIRYALKRRRRNRMIDPVDHRKWDK